MKKWLGSLLGTSLGISLAALCSITPLTHYYFGTISPMTLPASLLALPALPLLLLTGYLGLFLPEFLAEIFLGIFALMAKGMLSLMEILDSLPGTPIFVPQWPSTTVALTCVALLFLARAKFGFSFLIVIGGLLFLMNPGSTTPAVRITVFDVGHGTAVLCETSKQETILFDAGSLHRRGIGRKILLPYLRHHGLARLDHVILSHGDQDHWNALPELLPIVDVEQTYLGPGLEENALGWTSKYPSPNPGNLLRNDLVEVTLLPSLPDAEASWNDRSLALRLSFGPWSILLCGDQEEAGLQWLSSQPGIASNILLLPHHGLFSPGLSEFLDRTGAQHALASCGTHLTPRAESLKTVSGQVLTTNKEGSIQITWSPGNPLIIRTFASGVVFSAPR